MKLRTQIVGLGLVGMLMTALVGGIGLLSAAQLSHTLDKSISMGLALQKSQEADMMHDAIRGDVLLALLSALTQDAAGRKEAQKDLLDHTDTFYKAIEEMKALPLKPAVRTMADQVVPVLKNYVDAAKRVQGLAATDPQKAQAEMAEFQKAFKALEDAMESLSDGVSKDVQAYSAETASGAAATQGQVVVSLVVSAVLLVFAALWLANTLSEPMSHAVSVADRLAQGDLTSNVRPSGNDETIQLLQAMKRMQENFAGIVRAVKVNAENVATSSAEIAQGNNDLSNRTETQASSLEETSSSMADLDTMVKQNADSARQANQLAMNASTVAAQGGAVVADVVETMRGINESSHKIADIISVIDGIAFQTNILALNAAVEAARAGEQGRGFAVVASEVRSLAGRSAGAAREIKSLIGASVERVARGTALVDQAGSTMKEMVDSIGKVTEIMGEISSASNAQSLGVAHVGESIGQMDQATQQNAALVEQMAAAASSLKNQSEELVQSVATFRLSEDT